MPPSWKSDVARNEDGASAVLSWRHSRCVVVFRFDAIITPRSRTLARDASFFSVFSTASLWGLCLWHHIMRACVRTEPTNFNVFRHRTYCNALFVVFRFRCLRLVNVYTCRRLTISGTITDRSGPMLGRLATQRTTTWQWWKPCFFIEYSHFVHYNVVM